MAVSAVSTAGLLTVNPATDYSFFGQLVILAAIQIGGLGYMTFGSFVILASGGRISPSRLRIGRSILTMPEHFDPVTFLRHALFFTIFVQVIGSLALWWAFARAGVENPLWPAIFHSVSSYCTAGFSVFPNSLEQFSHDPVVKGIIAVLCYLGAIGFIVVTDIYQRMRGRSARITFTSRIILVATFGALIVGSILLFFDATLAELPLSERILAALFQAMAAQTTVGFNSVPVSSLSGSSVMILIVLMILGASPSGTGGGLKCTTWSAGLGACWSAMRGRKETTFLGSTVPGYRIQAAFAAFILYLIIYVLGCYVLLVVDNHKFEDVVFEAAAALSTGGLSRGITPELSDMGKVVIMVLMFIGRAGVVSLGLAALARPDADKEPAAPVEDIVVG
jgi:trk system potassium uptake protein TrkH